MDITVQELKERLDKGDSFIFIDVREAYEYDEFNIGAELRPLGGIMEIIEEYDEHKADEIVVCCRSGNRSGQAKGFMEQFGYTNVRNLLGGMLAWQEAFGK